MKKSKQETAILLRKNSTKIERLLWAGLRNRKLAGYKFRRQLIIKPYIVDFACLERKLIVEADGFQHTTSQQYDVKRDEFLRGKGFNILRFWSEDILRDHYAVCEAIRRYLEKQNVE